MSNHRSFVLVPVVGETPDDIMRTFDGAGDQFRADSATCQSVLKKGARPLLERPSSYEPVLDAQESPLALQAAAREAQRVGFDNLAQLVTSPSVAQRREMGAYLAETLAPEGPEPGPSPTGPSMIRDSVPGR